MTLRKKDTNKKIMKILAKIMKISYRVNQVKHGQTFKQIGIILLFCKQTCCFQSMHLVHLFMFRYDKKLIYDT